MKRLLTALLLAPIRAYRRWISPAFPRRCRYEPTRSAYAVQAITELGPFRGAVVAGWRVLRCNPFSKGGIDDLSDRTLFNGAAAEPHSHDEDDPSALDRRRTAVTH